MKPTHARIPHAGGYGRPMPNQFVTSGPMTHTVRDAAIMLQAMAGHDPRDPGSSKTAVPDYVSGLQGGVKGARIGWSTTMGYAAIDPGVAHLTARAATALQDAGAIIEAASIDPGDFASRFWTIHATNTHGAYAELYRERADELTEYGREAFRRRSEGRGQGLCRGAARPAGGGGAGGGASTCCSCPRRSCRPTRWGNRPGPWPAKTWMQRAESAPST